MRPHERIAAKLSANVRLLDQPVQAQAHRGRKRGANRGSPLSSLGKNPTELKNLRRNAHGQGLDAAYKAGIYPFRLANHLDPLKTLQDLFPDDFELQLGKPHADAAMDSEAERQMDARPLAVDD